MKQRYLSVIRLLLAWGPMKVEDIFRASCSFDAPFASIGQCRRELLAMRRTGLLGYVEVPDTGRGQKPFAYYLKSKASLLVPEVADVPRSNTLFCGLSKNPWHTLAVGEFGGYWEAHVAATPRVQIVERIRDGQFVFRSRNDELKGLIPDATLLLEVGGHLKLIFLELVNQTSVINPGSRRSRSRSLAGKLHRYRAFNNERHQHPVWQFLERTYGTIHGFQVLVVSTKDNATYLSSAAEGSNTMFLFANLSKIRASYNLLGEKIWWLPQSAWRQRGPQLSVLADHWQRNVMRKSSNVAT